MTLLRNDTWRRAEPHPSVTGIRFDITEWLKIKEVFAHRVYACILRYVKAAVDPHGGASAVANQRFHFVTRFKEILYLNLNFYSAYELFCMRRA